MPPELADSVAQDLVKFLLGGGALAFGGAVARFIWKWRTGRIAAERENNTTLENQRIAAIRERDDSDRRARRAIADNGRLRGLLLQNGIDPGDEPDFEKTITKTRRKKPQE